MIQENQGCEPLANAAAMLAASQEPKVIGVRVEQCEFELLFERAMEILDAMRINSTEN